MMHEVALMTNLLDTVEKVARREACGPVRTIHIRIGELSGVNVDALRFAFDVLRKGTVSEESTLECEIVPLVVRCGDCGDEFNPRELVFRCRACGSARIDVVTGREMEIDHIDVDDHPDGCGDASPHPNNDEGRCLDA
jgi:hydrogenase nickel incorporation protein HypA/HybF